MERDGEGGHRAGRDEVREAREAVGVGQNNMRMKKIKLFRR